MTMMQPDFGVFNCRKLEGAAGIIESRLGTQMDMEIREMD